MTRVPTHAEPWQVEEVGPASSVGAAHWATLSAGHSLYSGPDWIRHADLMRDGVPGHLVLFEGDRPVSALPTYTFEGTRPFYYDPDAVLGLHRAEGSDDESDGDRPPVCVAGTRLGYTSEFLTGALTDPGRRAHAARALLDAFRRRCADRGEPGAMLYVTDDSLALVLDDLVPDDQVVLMDGSVDLVVPSGGLDGYRDVVGKSRWKQFRHEMRRFESEGCELRILPMGDHLEEMGALAHQVSLRYGHDMTLQAEIEKLRDQAERLKDCVVMAAFRKGEMVGFTQFFLSGSTMFARGHGVAEEYGRRASVYFNLTYYAAIRWAAEHGYERIDLGPDSFDAKIIRGGRLHARWALVIAPDWSEEQRRLVGERQERMLSEFRTVDERVVTPTVHAVARRQGWETLLDGQPSAAG
ncbi:GNAT family N-acetyltransferase [Streptomyces sp. NPDC005492]|uniref:GNAT family N-acetyltransferase n=1 Tax=Streptomyces sp. NPDC005492 TaxID=3156883 RepID=UPI0033B1AD04